MATRSLGTLTLDLIARLGGFEQGMDKAARTSEKRMREIQRMAERTGSAIGLALGAGVAIASAGLLALTKNSISAGAALDDLTQKTGISVEALSGLQYAAKLEGVEDLEGSLAKFAKTLEASVNPTSAEAEALAALGVSARDSAGKLRPTEQILLDVAEAFAESEDSATKAVIAQALFGKSGAALIPFLNRGREGLTALTDEAKRYGLVITSESAAASADFEDAMFRLGAQIDGVGRQLAEALLPYLERVSKTIADPQFQTAVREWMDRTLDVVERIVRAAPTLIELFAAWKGAQVGGTIGSLFGPVGRVAGALIGAGVGGSIAEQFTEPMREFAASTKTAEQRIAELRAQVPPLVAEIARLQGDIHSGASAKRGTLAADAIALDAVLKQLASVTAALGSPQSDAAVEKPKRQLELTAHAAAEAKKAIEALTKVREEDLKAAIAAERRQLDIVLDFEHSLKSQERLAREAYEERNAAILATTREGEESRVALIKASEQRLQDDLDKIARERQDRRTDARRAIAQAIDSMQPEPQRWDIDGQIAAARKAAQESLLNTGQLIGSAERNGDISEDEAFKAREAAFAAFQDRLTEIEREGLAARRALQAEQADIAADIFGNLATVAEAMGGKGFQAYKALMVAQATASMISGAIGAYSRASEAFPPPYGQAAGAAAAAAVVAANAVKIAQINALKGYALGGYTGNFGRGEVAGVVHGQEFVVNAAATQQYRGLLEAINNGRVLQAPAVPQLPPARSPQIPASVSASLAAAAKPVVIENHGADIQVYDDIGAEQRIVARAVQTVTRSMLQRGSPMDQALRAQFEVKPKGKP